MKLNPNLNISINCVIHFILKIFYSKTCQGGTFRVYCTRYYSCAELMRKSDYDDEARESEPSQRTPRVLAFDILTSPSLKP